MFILLHLGSIAVLINVYGISMEQTNVLNSTYTSLQARDADLPASPAGLLGRFAPSGFALRSRISLALRFALTKIFEKKVCLKRLKIL